MAKFYDEILERGVDTLIDEASLRQRLLADRPLRLKFGIDPTSPDIHIGHAVVLWKLRQFQDLGHKLIIIIGDATAQIGDPTGKNLTRPILSAKEVEANVTTYLKQLGKIIDLKKADIVHNSQWLNKLKITDLIQLTGRFTVAQMIERDDFAKRLADGKDLHLHELLYPVMQAYDSVMVKADIEFGGSDQRFNILAGRDLQRRLGQPPQDLILTRLLEGTDGQKKMSKSLGNYIGISEPAEEIFGKVMSVPDEMILPYFELATLLPLTAVEDIRRQLADSRTNPRDLKMLLAREIVALYHTPAAASKAELAFVNQFQEGKRPEKIPSRKMSRTYKTAVLCLIDSGFVESGAEARRLIDQGGVKIDGHLIDNPLAPVKLKKGNIIQIGKRRFMEVK